MMRKRWKQKIILFLVLILSLCFMSVPVFAYSSIAPTVSDTTDSVYDGAGLLTSEEKADLEERIHKLEEEKGYRILILTTDYNPGTAMAYADDFFDFNPFGGNGILYLLDLDNRIQWISTTGNCTSASDSRSAYSDRDINSILDQTTSEASRGEYAACFRTFVHEVEKHGNLLYTLIPTVTSLLISLALALITFAILNVKHTASSPKNAAHIQVEPASFHVDKNDVIFTGQFTNTRRIPRNNDRFGGGGGGGMHIGGSGISHGGGGRGF